MGLVAVLHLDNDLLARVRLAIHIVDGRAVTVVLCRLLLVEQLQTGDVTLPFQQVVQKVLQQGLGELLTEDALEADISKRIDKLSHAAKLNIISETAKEWASFLKSACQCLLPIETKIRNAFKRALRIGRFRIADYWQTTMKNIIQLSLLQVFLPQASSEQPSLSPPFHVACHLQPQSFQSLPGDE